MNISGKKFKLWNRVTAAVVFFISAFTYLSTMEPTAPFWDCGEFTASSYKLEVGHPPGNPVFQLVCRLFTVFGDNTKAAVLANACSAICSAITVFLLYLTVVFFVKRIVRPDEEGKYSLLKAIAIFGSGAVGALVFCFSDTFWFSAVESEVYGMSSMFTALVVWAMIKWYDEADRKYANRWIVLIAFLMGLSIGVHLLNLLAIPVLVFLWYFKNREEGRYTFWDYVKILMLSLVILGFMVFLMIPYLPKMAAYTDLFFVNVLGTPYNTGAAFFVIALLGLCLWGLFVTMRKNKVLVNTVLLCFTMVVIGFSTFSICIIRSSVKTPTNEYQPDNAFTLVRYLSREQYGSAPLLYGQYFGAPYDLESPKYWAPLGGKYKHVSGPVDAKYHSGGKMLFPRMWSSTDSKHIEFYESYMGGKGTAVQGSKHKKPSQGANLSFFFDYQLNWMYWRYFLWNFAGRQNDIHGPTPNIFYGNWESGIKPLDQIRLGDQSMAPAVLAENKGKNHYFMIPLLLGLLGLFFQFDRDKRGSWLVFLLFFMTGIAIVMYLNQQPMQVRERDYVYAGSFYAFAIWCGLGMAAIYTWLTDLFKGKGSIVAAGVSLVACLSAPAVMAAENWDDHDRSNRRTSIEMARNYLNSVGPNGIVVTHGDNDTFPLWYAQEVENVRTDVRIVNTSLLGTDWHIDQMKYAVNESAPLPLTVPLEQYLYGTNEYISVYDRNNTVVPLADVMRIFKHPDAKATLADGTRVDYIMSHKFSVPVNRENVIKYGILPARFESQIPDEIVLTIPKDYITKQELFFLDLLSSYQWDRPINLLNQGGDIEMGIKDYLMFEGYSYKFIPIKNRITSSDLGLVDTEGLYEKMTKVYSWDALSRTDYDVDYQNLFTHLGSMPLRTMFVNTANSFMKEGHDDWALEMLDKCQAVLPEKNYPLEAICIGFDYNDVSVVEMVSNYYKLGQKEKARDLGTRFLQELMTSLGFFVENYDYAKDDADLCMNMVYYMSGEVRKCGDEDFANTITGAVETLLNPILDDSADTAVEPADTAVDPA